MPDSAIAAMPADEPTTDLNPLDALPYMLDTSIARWNQRLERRLTPIGLTFEQCVSPLMVAQDAVVLDSTEMSIEEVVSEVERLIGVREAACPAG